MDSAEMPLLVEAPEGEADLARWGAERRTWIEERLHAVGALLFRGFGVDSAGAFHDVVRAVSGEPLTYEEQSSPRSRVAGNIYTSTDYPARYPIFPHNENSYAAHWPMKLFFYCDTPAERGGETPVVSNRAVTRAIDAGVRERFAQRGVMYVRNFGRGLGLDWRTVFGTSDRRELETYCEGAGIGCEWLDGERVRTRQLRPAIREHPVSGEALWFNHATFFHVSTLEPVISEMLLASFGPEELPANTFYGDGSPIEPEVLDHLRGVYREHLRTFPWRRGDVMLVDNMLVAHGRAPYAGARRVLVAMTERAGDDPSGPVGGAGERG